MYFETRKNEILHIELSEENEKKKKKNDLNLCNRYKMRYCIVNFVKKMKEEEKKIDLNLCNR